MNNGDRIAFEDLAQSARRRRRVRMAREAVWWVVLLGVAVFLGWLLGQWIRALPAVMP